MKYLAIVLSLYFLIRPIPLSAETYLLYINTSHVGINTLSSDDVGYFTCVSKISNKSEIFIDGMLDFMIASDDYKADFISFALLVDGDPILIFDDSGGLLTKSGVYKLPSVQWNYLSGYIQGVSDSSECNPGTSIDLSNLLPNLR